MSTIGSSLCGRSRDLGYKSIHAALYIVLYMFVNVLILDKTSNIYLISDTLQPCHCIVEEITFSYTYYVIMTYRGSPDCTYVSTTSSDKSAKVTSVASWKQCSHSAPPTSCPFQTSATPVYTVWVWPLSLQHTHTHTPLANVCLLPSSNAPFLPKYSHPQGGEELAQRNARVLAH